MSIQIVCNTAAHPAQEVIEEGSSARHAVWVTFELLFPPAMRVGGGSLNGIADVVSMLASWRPLIITDEFLARSGTADRIADLLVSAGAQVAIYDKTISDPTTDSLADGLEALRSHEADSIVALGGGSPIDTAKALAVLHLHGGEMCELKAPLRYEGPALPVIAVPTTAGTGSEATMFTIITDSRTGEKMLCTGPSYLPAAALIDYELTLSMPPRLTADTGIDALSHAVEAFVSQRANAVSDTFALSAMKRIGKHLRDVYADGANQTGRGELMLASTLAGIAFSNASVALVHGMSRPLGAHFGIAHGMANAMLFAAVTDFSLGASPERYAECARALGVASPADSVTVASKALVTELRALAHDLDVPTPATMGVERAVWDAKIPIMTEQALASGSPANNPKVPSADEIQNLYQVTYA